MTFTNFPFTNQLAVDPASKGNIYNRTPIMTLLVTQEPDSVLESKARCDFSPCDASMAPYCSDVEGLSNTECTQLPPHGKTLLPDRREMFENAT